MGGEQTIGDITIFPCMDVCPCYAPQPNEKQYRPEIRYTHSPRQYLKNGFFSFIEKLTPGAAGFEKLPRHVDFLQISSVTLFLLVL